MLGNLSKKTKIKSISPKPVATPGTTFATGGKFPPGSFSNVSDYAGAVPKATKTGGQMYSTTYDLGTRISPGAIKPVKGAFKGGGSLKGRIDPSTGDRVSFKQYREIMKDRGKKYYEVRPDAKFGDAKMTVKGRDITKSQYDKIKKQKLPEPKLREENIQEDDMKGMSVKSGHKRPTKSGAGMTAKGVAAYRRRNPGSKLKTAVTGKVKKGSKDAKRRKSYCARSAGQMKKFPKAAKDPNSRLRQARRRWKC